MEDKVKFGCYVFQDGLDFASLRTIALECESLGFHSLWIKDNFTPWLGDWFSDWNGSPEKEILECWTTLSALASITKKIRLGAVLVNLYRSPSLVAKMASSFDRISGGRLEFGLSAGWHETECVSYGIPFPSPSKRVKMLEESIRVIRSMWTDQKVSFKGEFYKLREAVCEPKPLQKPHPPIWVGGGGRKTLRLAARYADGWIYGLCPKSEYLRALSELKEECKRLGRDWKSVAKAWYGILSIDEGKTAIHRGSKDDTVIVGAADEVVAELQDYLNNGVTHLIPSFARARDSLPLRRFAREVKPRLS
jgi:probable F420-dependent oxidoreductase